METQRASFSLGRSSLWLLLLGLVVPSASAQDLSYREAVLRAVDQFNERSSEANLYRLLELDPPPEQDVEHPGARKPVSFTVKETVCPRTTPQPPEQCDFKENGLVKQCVGTVTRYWIRGDFDITCNNVSGPFCTVRTARGVGCGISFGPMTHCPIQGRERFSYPGLSLPRAPGLQSWLCVP
nr:PREDICTED: cathelicidin-7 isoform X2 [Bos mutus]